MRRIIVLSGTLALVAATTGCPARDEAPVPADPPPAAEPATPGVEPAEPAPGEAVPTPPAEPPAATPPAAQPETPPPAAAPATPPAATPATPPAAAGPDLPPGVTQAMVQEGQQLYQTLCVACHGAAGAGTPIGPALNDQDWIHITGEFQEIVNITTTGVMQPREYPAPMPARGGGQFTDDQIRAISAYVYVLSHGG